LQSALLTGIMITSNTMAVPESVDSKTNEVAISPRDILFACPSCDKNLVVDEAAEGLIVDCPQCHISVIVPPKAGAPGASPTKPEPQPKRAAEQKTSAPEQGATSPEGDDLRGRLVTITSKLRELQTQRTEIHNRLASRMNDINRDLVMMARLETAQQQVIGELNQLVSQIGMHPAGPSSAAGRTRVNLRS
jgi:hypothetical protein